MKAQLFAFCTLLMACGGSIASPIGGSDAATDTGSTQDGSIVVDGGGSSKCPVSAPSDGAICSVNNLRCEYGSSNLTICNTIATCTDGAWSVPTPPPGPVPVECYEKNAPACPATFASVPVGTSCSKAYPTHCNYPEGECACTVDLGGPFPEDAASVAKWYCGKPNDAKCPLPRPKMGTPCNVPSSVSCDYGACVLPGGTVLECKGGLWQETFWACPG